MNSLFAFITILILSVFMISGGGRWIDAAIRSRPPPHQETLRRAARDISGAVGGYVAGALGQALVAGVTAFIVLSILVIVVFLLGLAYLLFRAYFRAIFYVISAGICFGFVATIAKVTINRFLSGNVDWLALLGLAGILAAGGLGSYFVQNAYSVGAPDLVIAGLTVIDPIVAVCILASTVRSTVSRTGMA